MLLIGLALHLAGYFVQQIFDEIYWQDWWQISNGIAHNFWAWGGLAMLAVVMRDRLSATATSIENWSLTLVFALSGFLHAGIDFICHRQDAPMSLSPLTR